jgi:hypothetical protein
VIEIDGLDALEVERALEAAAERGA